MGCQTQIKTDEFKFRSVPFDYVLIAISLTLHISGTKKYTGPIPHAACDMQVHSKTSIGALHLFRYNLWSINHILI